MAQVVVDTNVLVSALTHNGKSRKLVLKLLNAHTVILSRQILAELADVLARRKFNIASSQIHLFLSTLVEICRIVQDNRRFNVVSGDPDDDIILNAAYAGKADYVVTGDKHLLALARFKKTRIVTVNQMLETIE